MPTPERNAGTDLIDLLVAEPYRFEFFQAVRLALAHLHEQHAAQIPGRIRFHNRLSLAFPPSQLDAVALAPRADGGDDIDITPAFLGLLGGTGTLPLHYSESIAAYERSTGDAGPRAFLDLLSHRAQALFYEAWARHRPECLMTAPDGDAFLAMLTALAGVAPEAEALAPRRAIAPETLAFYAARLRCRTSSSHALGGVLSDYFSLPFTVESLVGAWQRLPPEHQAQLGGDHFDLDAGVVLGDTVFGCDARARIRIGPLDQAAFDDFLPGAAGAVGLAELLGLHCGAGITYEIVLVLRAADVHGIWMVNPGEPGSARLGYDSWLTDGAETRDRDDVTYLLEP